MTMRQTGRWTKVVVACAMAAMLLRFPPGASATMTETHAPLYSPGPYDGPALNWFGAGDNCPSSMSKCHAVSSMDRSGSFTADIGFDNGIAIPWGVEASSTRVLLQATGLTAGALRTASPTITVNVNVSRATFRHAGLAEDRASVAVWVLLGYVKDGWLYNPGYGDESEQAGTSIHHTILDTASSALSNTQTTGTVGAAALVWKPAALDASAYPDNQPLDVIVVLDARLSRGEPAVGICRDQLLCAKTNAPNPNSDDLQVAGQVTSMKIVTATAPGTPTGVSAVGGDGQATVSWSPPADDGGSPITSYVVQPSTGPPITVEGSTRTTITGLTNGTPYGFTVAAVNSVGTGPASMPPVEVTPATVPGSPANVVATPGNAQAVVSWTPPPDNGGAAITSYVVTASPGGRQVTVDGPTTQATFTHLTNGTTYSFTVAAANRVGTGSASSPSTPVTPATTPAAPQLSATPGNGSVLLSWTSPDNGGSAITGYRLYRGTTSGGETLLASPGNVSTYTDASVQNGATYYYKVSAVNGVGEGALSAEAVASPTAPPTPASTPAPSATPMPTPTPSPTPTPASITGRTLTAGNSATSATTVSTAPITPTAGALELTGIETRSTQADAIPTLSGCGVTWARVASIPVTTSSPFKRVTLFRAQSGRPSSSCRLVFGFGGTTMTDFVWSTTEYTNVVSDAANNGAGAVRQVQVASGAGTTAKVSMSAFSSPKNAAYGLIGTGSSGTITPGTHFAELNQQRSGTNLAEETELGSAAATVDATFPTARWAIVGAEIVNAY